MWNYEQEIPHCFLERRFTVILKTHFTLIIKKTWLLKATAWFFNHSGRAFELNRFSNIKTELWKQMKK
jgi:hypothetical protein